MKMDFTFFLRTDHVCLFRAPPHALAGYAKGVRPAPRGPGRVQYLPGRQRAVLILRDVLMWRAAEVAELLGISTVAANSMLQRALPRRLRAWQARRPADGLHRLILRNN
jgi:hypothetical protein